VVTTLGGYSRTIGPGIGMTFPAPVDRVQKIDVEEIRTIDIGSTDRAVENLILTGDQNIIDLAYSVRWNISDPELYLFQIANPEETIREVAESSMRAVVAGVSLDDAIGAGRGEIEQRVEQTMQQLLDDYKSGIAIQGIAIKQSDPPAAVTDAFKDVSAAQQEAQSYINQARAYALQLTAKAQGEAAAFDKVYTQYRLSPEVTRRRMYYETMERVLSRVDKTIVEAPGVTPYLPLPEVQKQQQRQQPAAPEGAAR
jgi:membrane protease subunit HflK